MGENLKDQINVLVKLQDVETEKIKLKIDMNETEQRFELLDEELKEYKNRITESEVDLEDVNRSYRSLESDSDANQEKLRKSMQKLDSVKNNKEYQSILKEIEDLKAENSQIEDKMIECLNHIEEGEKKISSLREEYSLLLEKNEKERESIQQHLHEGNTRLKELDEEWERISQAAEPDMLRQYLDLKERIKGSVIASVKDAICNGCHMNIPPQTYNELQRFDSLKYCPFCQRIIYWKN